LSAIEYRAARFDEFPLAAALRQEMSLEMGGDFDALAPDWRAKFCQYFGGKQAAGNAQLFLAFDAGAPVGCATISILDDYRNFVFNQRAAHVNAVFVKPAYRRRGIARRLMEMLIAWARERGCTRVRLRASDDGRLLYQALGFAAGREMELSL
jgi:GNAT superfamily N-acetyltransferase